MVRLLGPLDVTSGGTPLHLPTRKTRALLAYLAFPARRAHTREKLTALLWGDSRQAQARQSLRHALAALRRALNHRVQPALRIDGETVKLEADGVDVDAIVFERLATTGDRDALQRAAALYQGDFLEGFAAEAGPFEDWLLTERERLRQVALTALHRLLERQLSEDSVEAAVATALRALAIDPLQEPLHRTVMQLYARQSCRTAAIRQYRLCAQTLQRELGLEPDSATQALYRSLLHADCTDRRVGTPAGPAAAAPGLLVGRDAELRRLDDLLGRTTAAAGGVAVITGEAGVGKTRLVEELARRAGAFHVLRGHFHETARSLPLHGWVEALQQAVGGADHPAWAGLPDGQRVELTRLLPARDVGTSPSRRARPRDPLRVFRAVTDLLLALSREHPVLLVLEDLHWADDMSLALLAFCGRHVAGHRLLLLGTAREAELLDRATATTAVEELSRHRLHRLHLEPLSRRDTPALVAAVAGGRLGEQLARVTEEVWRLSEGNPFVIVESLRGLEGTVVTGAIDLPSTVRSTITTRLRRLSPAARELTAVAAIVGRQAGFTLLQRASGLAAEEATEAVEELVGRGVLELAGEEFRFVHERVREVAYAGLLPPRRALLHGLVATALEALHADRLDTVSDRLAHHWVKAGDDARALHALRRLAGLALQRSGVEAAIETYRAALALAERQPALARDRAVVEVVVGLAEALLYAGQPLQGVVVLREHQSAVVRVNHDVLTARHQFWLAHLLSFLDEPERALEQAQRALEAASRAGDRAGMGRAHYVIGRACYRVGTAARGIAHGREAVALLEGSHDASWLGHAHWVVALNLGVAGRYVEALDDLTRAAELGSAAGDVRLEAYAAWGRSWSYIAMCHFEHAVEAARRAVELAPDPLHRACALTYLGAALMKAGRTAEAIDVLRACARAFEGLSGLGYMRAYAAINLGTALLDQGHAVAARDEALRALELSLQGRLPTMVGRAQRLVGLAHRALGKHAEAEACLRQAVATCEAIRPEREVTLLHLAEALHDRGADEEATGHLRDALAGFRALRLDGFAARAEALAGRLGLSL